MTVAPVGNMMAIFEAQIARNDTDLIEVGDYGNGIEDSYYVKASCVASVTKSSDSTKGRNPSKARLAESIRDKVKLFDKGQLTFVQKLNRELDFRPDEAEFDPAQSKTVFERRSSIGPGVLKIQRRRALSPTLSTESPSLSVLPSSDDDESRTLTGFTNLPASPRIKKNKSIRRASTGAIPCLDEEEEQCKEKSPKRKKKKRSKEKTNAAVSSSSECETIPESPKRESRKTSSTHTSPVKPPTKPPKSPGKSKSPRKSSSRGKSKESTLELPKTPSLEKSNHKRRRGRRKDKKKSTKKKSSEGKDAKAAPSSWDLVLLQHDRQRRALFGSLHRSMSMTLLKAQPLTPERRMARRASTGRLLNELGVQQTNLWEVHATHAMQITERESDTENTVNTMRNQEEGDSSETDGKSGARPAPRHRMLRRHSTGSFSARSTESEETLLDFWHTYEEECDSDSSVSASDESQKPPLKPPTFTRRRTVRFDQNVTVWVFTSEDAPPACDLELPQAFRTSTPAADLAPRAPIRRNHSMEMEQRTPRVDGAPSPPKRNRSIDLVHELVLDDVFDYEDDAKTVDSWPVPSRQSRQTDQRKKKHNPRVRFAEELEKVRYYVKDSVPEVVLPQIGIIFCATSHTEEDQAPQVPRRNNSNAVNLACSIEKTISVLRRNEDIVRENRETDLKPRQSARVDSLRSLKSENSDESTISLPDCDDVSLEDLSDEEKQDKLHMVSALRPGNFRGNSIRRIDNVPTAVQKKYSFPQWSLRPGSMRGDSIRSLGSVDSSVSSKEEASNMTHPQSLRPERFRGDSIKQLIQVGSAVSVEAPMKPSYNSVSRSLRPTSFRGDSFIKSKGSVPNEGVKEIIWEGSEEPSATYCRKQYSGRDFNPQVPPCILEIDAEDNTESCSQDDPMIHKSPTSVLETSPGTESRVSPVKKSRKVGLFGRRRRDVATSQSNDGVSGKSNIFTNMTKRSKLLRFSSGGV